MLIGGLVALGLALLTVLFLLSTFWTGERIYLTCKGSAPWGPGENQTAGILFERMPPWVVWGEGDGRVYFDTPLSLFTFNEVRDRKLQLSFDGGPDGFGHGTISKVTSRVAIMLKDGRGTFIGLCESSPDIGLR